MEIFRLDEVVCLPCSQSPLKNNRPTASALERLRWLKKGLAGEKWAKVSSLEVERAGTSYSVDTASHWREKSPNAKLFWIMGSDQWKVLPKWKEFKKLGRWVHFLVFPRPIPPKSRKGIKMSLIPARFDLSSTQIRYRLKEGLSIRGMVLPQIEKPILESRSYR
jgi:nicotinate-nucleotide adenylyltransferase